MKKCPFCAEEIQDAAVVCKHCGRDLVSTATAQKGETVQPKKKTGCLTWIVVAFVGLLLFAWLGSLVEKDRPSTTTSL